MKHHSTYAASKPHEPAIVMGGSGETVTWREYSLRVNRIAQYLKDIGLKEKDHIAILLENCAAYMEIATAAADAFSNHLLQPPTVNVRRAAGKNRCTCRPPAGCIVPTRHHPSIHRELPLR